MIVYPFRKFIGHLTLLKAIFIIYSMMNTANVPIEHTYIAQTSDAGLRLDVFLATNQTTYSRSFIKNLICEGQVLINGKKTQRPSSVLKAGDMIFIQHIENQKTIQINPTTLDLGITVIFEHEHFLVINKPAGLLVHAAHAESADLTVVDWLAHRYPELQSIGSGNRPGIIHRIDKDTSGLLIIPRTNYAYTTFGSFFEKRTIKKTYIALVHNHPDAQGIIDFPIARHVFQRIKMNAVKPHEASLYPKTRHALTKYQVLSYFKDYSLVEVHPITGRTHQIRVHLSALGYPIVGDVVYGNASPFINRQALHAYRISFEFDQKPYLFEAAIPTDILNCVKNIQ